MSTLNLQDMPIRERVARVGCVMSGAFLGTSIVFASNIGVGGAAIFAVGFLATTFATFVVFGDRYIVLLGACLGPGLVFGNQSVVAVDRIKAEASEQRSAESYHSTLSNSARRAAP